ncbi:MAG: type II toxin-antitoxin system HicA family toxin [Caldilineaceae bacterium]
MDSRNSAVTRLCYLGGDACGGVDDGGGCHLVMRHTASGVKIPVPFHGGRDIPIETLRAILRQAGATVETWLEL